MHTATTGQGPDLLLIHGWGLSASIWSGIQAELSRAWRVTCVDLPGHGHSREGPVFTLDGTVAQLLAAAPARAVWVGWSLGGLLALEAAARAPERIAGLCLVASNPRFVRGPDWPHGMEDAVLRAFGEALVREPDRTLNRFLALQVRGSERAQPTLRTLRAETDRVETPALEALAAGLDILRRSDLRHRLGDYPGPRRFIMGERDLLVPCSAARACARYSAQTEQRVIPGAGHAPFLSHPAAFLDALDGFPDRDRAIRERA
jgi:pimeloyl-[acyl-carrier protein] methyl ester esterase